MGTTRSENPHEARSKSMYCLETCDLHHRYPNGTPVLDGLALQVPTGSIYGFLGPNGAGKTTTLRLVLGLLEAQRGTITIFGKRLAANRIEVLRDIGSLIESPSVYEHLTARENLAVLQRVHRCPPPRIDEVLNLVGLRDTGSKRAGAFSLGMKQRLGIAAALLHAPALLILDEPTNGLDPGGIVEMRELLARLNRERGTTIVVSSHLLAEVERLATHLCILHRGRTVFQGPLEDLRRTQQPMRSVRIATRDDAAALAIIAAMAPDARIVDGAISLPAMPAEDIARLNRLLVERGIDVHELRPVVDDLESIFMDLVEARAT